MSDLRTTCPICASAVRLTPKGSIRKHLMVGTAVLCWASGASLGWAQRYASFPDPEWVGKAEQEAAGAPVSAARLNAPANQAEYLERLQASFSRIL